ncbi:MAG: hypothetical protein ABUS79_23270, partial [Pseudomonadota bacterium]
ADSLRAELGVQRTSWQRQLDTARAQQAALRDRFGRQRPLAIGAQGASGQAAATRLAAALDGAAQSVVDLDSQQRQIGDQVEAAIAKGTEEGRHALDGARERMNEQLSALAADGAALIAEVDNFGRSESIQTTQNETGARR